MIRPQPARWFEALVARDDCTLLLEALAASGAVELEARAGATLPAAFAAVRPELQRFFDYQSRYAAWWPTRALEASAVPEPPAATLHRGLAALDAWALDAEPAIRALERNAAERAERLLWRNLIGALAGSELDLGALARAGPLARAAVIEHALDAESDKPGPLLARPLVSQDARYSIVLGSAADLEAAARDAAAAKGRAHPVPPWLSGNDTSDLAAIEARLADLDADDRQWRALLEQSHRRRGLHRALADLYRLQWVLANVSALETGDRLATVTGWSSDRTGIALRAAVDRSGARALIHFAQPPANARAPLILSNPRWARPFELFPGALGVPGSTEADPTVLLAVVVPLLFGYMFGDVGQGLLLVAAGWWLRRRTPVARLLMAGGVAAIAFGFVFGSVFGIEGVVPALWTEPLAEPVTILAVPIGAGAALLAVGLVLHAMGSLWRAERARFWGEDLGLLALYIGILASAFVPGLYWLAIAGAAAFLAGHAIHAGKASALGSGLGELLERTLQLFINTLSFARVGAFALAHAGLASAVVALAMQSEHLAVRVLVFVLGNALMITLEAMVVSIQTTRLVLFEFFARFLTGSGRAFRPLPPPPSVLQESRP
jgi:V/A-type H+-transporting ATPase subunit I